MKTLDENKGREIYYRLDALARERGTRISTVCDELNLRRALVSDLKSGRVQTIGSNYIADFANYFHVTMDFIYSGIRDDIAITSDEILLLKAWRNASDGERENVAFILRDYGVVLPKKDTLPSFIYRTTKTG